MIDLKTYSNVTELHLNRRQSKISHINEKAYWIVLKHLNRCEDDPLEHFLCLCGMVFVRWLNDYLDVL